MFEVFWTDTSGISNSIICDTEEIAVAFRTDKVLEGCEVSILDEEGDEI